MLSSVCRNIFYSSHVCMCVHRLIVQFRIIKYHQRFSYSLASAAGASIKIQDPLAIAMEKRPKEKEDQLQKKGKAVWHLKNIYLCLGNHFNSKDGKRWWEPRFEFNYKKQWQCSIHVTFPEIKQFTGTGINKRLAEKEASIAVIKWLKEKSKSLHDNQIHLKVCSEIKPHVDQLINFDSFLDVITANYKLKIDEENKGIKKEFSSKQPLVIQDIPQEIVLKMNSFLQEYDKVTKALMDEDRTCKIPSTSFLFDQEEDMNDEGIVDKTENEYSSSIMFNVLNNRIFREMSEREKRMRSYKLKSFLQQRVNLENNDNKLKKFRDNFKSLPVNNFRQQILESIKNNQVVVISGETGCGKTTQIPQFIFEDSIEKDEGANCSIVVTQPRRLPAIAISEQVAYQFGENNVGKSIGYQVRFGKCVPESSNGGILFCTAGILLRKLENNPDLKGVSHVIVDEVHEREVVVDFLLILLKRLIQRNKDVKIILMSASINAHLFAEYFGPEFPVIEIPGRCYPVQSYYLPDYIDKLFIKKHKELNVQNPKVIVNLIVELIRFIDQSKPDGAILCFLPGWNDIENVQKSLNERQCEFSNALSVLPVHSKIPYSEQKRIFQNPPSGVRKVVLSTNICETSITVPDVVYVIDPGLCNEVDYNENLNVSTFGTHFISQANAVQRQGRAGRVQPGECYKVYSKNIEETSMRKYPTPEILRIPLESVVMQAKLYCLNEKVEEFLAYAPQPPSKIALEQAIQTLKGISILDKEETLTDLGKRIVHFSIHPRLSVALVAATMNGCLKAVLNIVSVLSAPKDILRFTADKTNIYKIKKQFIGNIKSDHLFFAKILQCYDINYSFNQDYSDVFCDTYFLKEANFKEVLKLRELFASHLTKTGLIRENEWKIKESDVNENCGSKELILASLMMGLYPNIIRCAKMTSTRRHVPNQLTNIDIRTGDTIRVVGDSILKDNNDVIKLVEDDLMFYYLSFYSEDSKKLTIKDVSIASPLIALLFTGKEINKLDSSDNMAANDQKIILKLDGTEYLKFIIPAEHCNLLMKWKMVLYDYSTWYVTAFNSDRQNPNAVHLHKTMKKFLSITKDLLKLSSDSEILGK